MFFDDIYFFKIDTYRGSQYWTSTALHEYEEIFFSTTILEDKKWQLKKSNQMLPRFFFQRRPLISKYVKKCGSKMHLKVFENLEKARKWLHLLYESLAEIENISLLCPCFAEKSDNWKWTKVTF